MIAPAVLGNAMGCRVTRRARAANRRGLISTAVAVALATAVSMLVVAPAGATPQATRVPACGALHVVAHRGDRDRTENTLGAFRSAVHRGADAVETDLRTSSDGRLVLLHDRTLGRTTHERGRVRKLTGREIHAVRTNDGQHVPYVDMVLRFLHDRPRISGVIELKSMTRPSMVLLRHKMVRFHVMRQVTLSSKHPKYLKRAKRMMPHVRRDRLTWRPLRPKQAAHYLNGVIIPLWQLDNARVDRYQQAGLRVVAMASVKRRSRKRMAKIGLDAVSSNNIPGFVKFCRTPRPAPRRPHHARAGNHDRAGNDGDNRHASANTHEATDLPQEVTATLVRIWSALSGSDRVDT